MMNISQEFLPGLFGFLLTLMILSYVIKDNPLFRVAVYIFVGVSAGYAATVAWNQVLIPHLFIPLIRPVSFWDRILALFPLLLGALLLTKISPRTAHLGSPSMAFLVGVGAAVAVSGAVLGTIFPQTQASINMFNLNKPGTSPLETFLEGTIILLGTVATLVYFHFGAKATPIGPQRSKLVNALGWAGQIFIAITFGVLFAGAFTAAITAFIERLDSIKNFIALIIKL
jgi:hypothetical protein